MEGMFRVGFLLLTCCLLLAHPSLASAQWYGAAFLGANTTRAADVTVKGDDYDLTFPKVEFDGQPFTSPQYYGWRVGRFLSSTRRVGVELEFIHLKVIANPEQLQPEVQRYQMTHGLNFIVVNLTSRLPLGRSAYGDAPYALVSRIGAGATVAHAETTVFDEPRELYEYSGLGAHVALGLDVRVRGRLSLFTDYKLTYARPTISTARGGTGRTTTLSHHAAFGLAFGLSR